VSTPGVSGQQRHDATDAVCVSPIPLYWDSSYNSLQRSAAGGRCKYKCRLFACLTLLLHTVDHQLHHLERQFDLRGVVLAWFASYVTDASRSCLMVCQPRSLFRVRFHKVQFWTTTIRKAVGLFQSLVRRFGTHCQMNSKQGCVRDLLSRDRDSIWLTLRMWLINTMWSSTVTLTTLRCTYTVSVTIQCLPSLVLVIALPTSATGWQQIVCRWISPRPSCCGLALNTTSRCWVVVLLLCSLA